MNCLLISPSFIILIILGCRSLINPMSTMNPLQLPRKNSFNTIKTSSTPISICALINGLTCGKIYRKPSIFPWNMGVSCNFSLKHPSTNQLIWTIQPPMFHVFFVFSKTSHGGSQTTTRLCIGWETQRPEAKALSSKTIGTIVVLGILIEISMFPIVLLRSYLYVTNQDTINILGSMGL